MNYTAETLKEGVGGELSESPPKPAQSAPQSLSGSEAAKQFVSTHKPLTKPRRQRKSADMAKNGRPTTYTEAKADQICELISEGYTLRRISEEFPDLPYKRTVLGWLAKPDLCPGFSEKYDRAREVRAELMAHEIEEIADDARNDWMDRELANGRLERVIDNEAIQRSRLRVDTRKWLMSKMMPRKFGDKLEVDHSGRLTLALLVEQAHQQIADRGQTIEHDVGAGMGTGEGAPSEAQKQPK